MPTRTITGRNVAEALTDALAVERGPGTVRERRNPRAPVLIFVAVVIFGGAFYVGQARRLWFFKDEWDFFTSRSLSSFDDLLRPHNEHWTTIPIVVYRLLYAGIGLRSYLAYAVFAIGLHLLLATLVRVVALRAGVNAWIATVVASSFVLFGAASYDILWSFQITFTGAIVLGVTSLLLIDHDGPFDRRDLLGGAAGLGALMCSGIGITMVIIAACFAVVRRGWRIAALYATPLASIYLTWWWFYARDFYRKAGSSGPRSVATFVDTGLDATLHALGNLPLVGIALEIMLAAGLAVFLTDCQQVARRRALLPLVMLAGAVLAYGIVGVGRVSVEGEQFATQGRYLHVAAALMLPALALAIDALLRRWRVVGAAAMCAIVAGIPGNVRDASRFAESRGAVSRLTRTVMLSVPQSPLADDVPAAWIPDPTYSGRVTVGWLREAYGAGRLPGMHVPPEVTASNAVRLSIVQLARRVPSARCRPVIGVLALPVEPGGGFVLRGGSVYVQQRERSGLVSRRVPYDARRGPTFVSYRALDLRISSPSKNKSPPTICALARADR